MARGSLHNCYARAVNLTLSLLGGQREREIWSVTQEEKDE